MGVSDGSYYSLTFVTTAAWTLESLDGTKLISDMTTPFYSQLLCHGAYRAELTDLIALIHMSTHLCFQHNTDFGTLHIGCDNIQELQMSFEQPTKHTKNSKQKHSDLLSGMSSIILNLHELRVTYKHMQAHQDSLVVYKDLSGWHK